MTTFFISDTHFGHERIIYLAKRPFRSLDEMDAVMIENWNKKVQSKDTVYFLGDFSWYKYPESFDIFRELNGTKNLIKGNHDEGNTSFWHTVSNDFIGPIDGQHFHLYHYPLVEWDKQHKKSIHLYGHVHGKPITWLNGKRAMDVGVESLNYTPISCEEVIAFMKDKS